MKHLRIILGLILVLVTSRAFAQKVMVDYDHQANFQAYKTYAWTKGTPVRNQLWDQRIVDGIDKQLAAKGLQKVDASANPDLDVLYHGAVDQQTQFNTMGMGGFRRFGGGMATTTVDKIPMGQLIVNIGDPKTKRLLWTAKASDTLSDKPEKDQKKLDKTLEKMFRNFPPKPSAK